MLRTLFKYHIIVQIMLVVIVGFITFCNQMVTHGEVLKIRDKYTTKYDNVNLEDILSNKRLLMKYVRCLLNEAPCTADGAELKKSLPDAIATECSKCSEKQREGSIRVIRHLIRHEEEIWKQLEKIYDPTGEFKKRYMDQREVKIVPITTTTEESY